MVKRRIPVLDIMIDAVTMAEAVKIVENFIAEQRTRFVATANAEMVMMAQTDPVLAGILNRADLVIPDGAGVVWAARYHQYAMPERVAGYDLVQQLLAKSARSGYRVYFFGGAPGVAEQARTWAEARYPGVNVVGVRDGYFTAQDEPEIINTIKLCKPDILLAGLGVPKQEKWLTKHLNELNVPVAIGVGGTFDVMAGVVIRAPLWMQKANLEWLYRLLSQPQRALRMLALPRFMLKVAVAKKD
ncbi:N-acetylglucosaminyldiphosphoundecaprenol N-acetyl-beta-D-mannosaminyltransferase [Dendrosporobacter quercicolus]|uniref:N-acetylglucosaminyldiphosphoundecaprenol N-acetyl-beta-D-mannosaminyltransferase n=1 Tax=Dendrosporobacter quercicolus TaxID=146817 RepID=A0A1G9M1H2_9FIRM|nr:N-acetylglucosaminyldiphosphoundecaprenol N-acetyl-beta-D-mannosaminyltransferase [Dendrosporobacter quercicolus]